MPGVTCALDLGDHTAFRYNKTKFKMHVSVYDINNMLNNYTINGDYGITIHNLKKFGYDVTYKSHPLTNKKIVEKLCNTSDIKNKEGLLEKVYHKYNYLIFFLL